MNILTKLFLLAYLLVFILITTYAAIKIMVAVLSPEPATKKAFEAKQQKY